MIHQRGSLHEVSRLKPGMDLRRPEYRRETFLRFYLFNLAHRVQPGCVHYVLPFLRDHHGLSRENCLWLNFLCMSPGNLITGYSFFRRWPSFRGCNWDALKKFFRDNYATLGWDTDRRWEKNHFPELLDAYRSLITGYGSQANYYDCVYESTSSTRSPIRHFETAWKQVRSDMPGFGRMTTYSFLERLRILGEPLECPSLYLNEIGGSKAHRNGLCKVLGRDDLDWHRSNPSFDGKYPVDLLAWLTDEGALLLEEARSRIGEIPFTKGNANRVEMSYNATYLTLESTFCTYKSWFRKNRRYPNVYNDWMLEQIKLAEQHGDDCDIFREARKKMVAPWLRAEDNPNDPGWSAVKQNWFRETGEVIMMSKEWPGMSPIWDRITADRKPTKGDLIKHARH